MSGQSLTVLLIEDNPGDARLIRETLADAKDVPYNLECADRLSTGLARLVARGIDVVLLDLSLPDSHGLETFVKTQTQAPELPIIILTGLDDETLALEPVRKGAQDYLVKGQVDTHLLVRATRHAVERKRAEKALRWLEKAVETMELGVTITDTDGRIVYIHSADASMHGHTVEDLIGKDVRILAPSELGEPMTVDQTQKVDTWRRQSVNIRKDGTTFPVQLISGAVTNAAGEPIGIATICEDITERKRVEEELEAAQLQLIQSAQLESVGRLAAGVAHEVKNPLSIILMGVNYLSGHLDIAGDDGRLILQDMEHAVKRADSVIRGLLDFSAARELDLKMEDLNAIVEQSLALVKHELDKCHVNVVGELSEDLPPVELDKSKIQQVFINIFMNAIHAMTLMNATYAMPTGGTLTVRTHAKRLTEVGPNVGSRAGDRFKIGDTVVIAQVEDTGTGIPEDQVTKIFDPFFTTKPTGKGTGLGLAVTNKIIELHGGTIDIRNRKEVGARVTIMFKAREA